MGGAGREGQDRWNAEAARSCRGNAVAEADCGFTSPLIRAIPSHAIGLASVYLDRNVAAALARPGCDAELEAEAGSRRVHSSLRCGSHVSLHTPWFSALAREC